MSCPNRDKDGKGGCIFCSEGGSGDFAEKPCGDVNLQLSRAMERVKQKKPGGYIAYFQSFTNTYAPVDYLRSLFFPAILHPEVCALSVATRPDCLDAEVLALLSELNRIKPVFVELGLQTADDSVAAFIRRGYETAVFARAVRDLKAIGINTIAHVILFLPHAAPDDGLKTVRYAVDCGIDGVKLQLLHVLKNTPLAEIYRRGEYSPPSKEEYISLLLRCVKALPQDVVLHRMTGDAPKKLLLAPLWSADKKRVLNDIHAAFAAAEIAEIPLPMPENAPLF